MRYITTSCSNCGFRTRNHEGGVPSVQIGAPVLPCPKCGHLILDSIVTEYEFMTDGERKRFTTETAGIRVLIGNLFIILVGFFLLIGGLITGEEYTIIGLLFGGGIIGVGVFTVVKNIQMKNEQIIEQAVYESLQRTKNRDYVEFIKRTYMAKNIKRYYRAFTDKNNFIEKYQTFETRKSYIENMKAFNELLELIGVGKSVEEDETSTFINP